MVYFGLYLATTSIVSLIAGAMALITESNIGCLFDLNVNSDDYAILTIIYCHFFALPLAICYWFYKLCTVGRK